MKNQGLLKNRSAAFTLVELLVCIGIIAILLAFLLPSLSTAPRPRQGRPMRRQLRELGHAFQMYANAFGGSLPGWSGWHNYPEGATPDDQPGPSWMEKIAPYIGTPDKPVFNCPSFPPEYPINYFLTVRWAALQIPPRHAVKFTDVRLSSQFIISGDCTAERLYSPWFGIAGENSNDCDKDDATQQGIVWFGEPGGRNMHRGGNNVLFADNHIELKRRFEKESMTFNPHRMEDWASVTPVMSWLCCSIAPHTSDVSVAACVASWQRRMDSTLRHRARLRRRLYKRVAYVSRNADAIGNPSRGWRGKTPSKPMLAAQRIASPAGG